MQRLPRGSLLHLLVFLTRSHKEDTKKGSLQVLVYRNSSQVRSKKIFLDD